MREDNDNGRFRSIANLVDVFRLAVARVMLIGLGRMGAPVAAQLVRHGVATERPGSITLIDDDVVEEHNLVATPYFTKHIGMPKVEALAEILQEIDPKVRVNTWRQRLTQQDIPVVTENAEEVDLVGHFDDDTEISPAKEDALHALCPQVKAHFGLRCDFAEVGFSIPQETVPLRTTFQRKQRQTITQAEALGTDTMYVANFVAAVCLQLLLPEPNPVLPPCYANAPLFLVGLRHEWVFESMPPDEVRTIFLVESPSEASATEKRNSTADTKGGEEE